MRQIVAKKLSVEAFKKFGEYYNMLEPEGHNLGGFYHDKVTFNVSGDMRMGFSSLVSRKQSPMVIDTVEYHNTTCEGVMPLDDDVVLHVAPASNDNVSDLTEVFIVPKGYFVRLNPGVFHKAALPIHLEEAHILISLPERIYFNDCHIVQYSEEEKFEIIVE